MRKLLLVFVVGACASSIGASTALANGPCGINYDGNHPCLVNSPASINGSLITDNEADFYIFWAAAGTQLNATVTDLEDPHACASSAATVECGDVRAELTDVTGNELDSSGTSSPTYPGITVPRTITTTISATGDYYLVLSGNLGEDAHGSFTREIPYSLNVTANPGVQWPPPPPPAPPAPAPTPTPTPTPTPQTLSLSMSTHGDRRHHHTDVTVGVHNSAGAAVGSGLLAVFQVWVNHHWSTLSTARTAPYSVRVSWPRRDRGESWTVRAVVSGAGYQTASTAIRVRGV